MRPLPAGLLPLDRTGAGARSWCAPLTGESAVALHAGSFEEKGSDLFQNLSFSVRTAHGRGNHLKAAPHLPFRQVHGGCPCTTAPTRAAPAEGQRLASGCAQPLPESQAPGRTADA